MTEKRNSIILGERKKILTAETPPPRMMYLKLFSAILSDRQKLFILSLKLVCVKMLLRRKKIKTIN